MSWMETLYRTYENVEGEYLGKEEGKSVLLPIFHSQQNAQVHVILDDDGRFREAAIVPKKEAVTLIPITESSAGRSGKKVAPHPLCDKLQYIAGDFLEYGGKAIHGYAEYMEQLEAWCESVHAHPKIRAVRKYLAQGSLIRDLVDAGVLHEGPDGNLLTKWTDKDRPQPEIFGLITSKNQLEAFVRFSVQARGERQSTLWTDKTVWRSWIDFSRESNESENGLCFVTGETRPLAVNHPKRIRYGGDGAKLISANDNSGFTFRGRFTDPRQVCGIGLEVTQKAHNALRWLIARQGMIADGLAVVAWSVSGKMVPAPCSGTDWLAGEPEDGEEPAEVEVHDAGLVVGRRFRKKLQGYKADLGDIDRVVVMALDSATPGRMAIKYYRELSGSEYLARVEDWHRECAWEIYIGKRKKYVGAPSPQLISRSAYGSTNDEKVTIERLLPCIVDGSPIPRDIVDCCVRRAGNRSGLEPWEWETALSVACALYRYQHKGEYDMTLDRSRQTRDYLYGRLLAIADHMERAALTDAEKKRSTNAARIMQRFASRPFSTWRTVGLGLGPYQDRLMANKPGLARWLVDEMQSVHDMFDPDEFSDDSPLSGEFLLGFYCQRADLWKGRNASENNDDNE